MNLPFDSPEMGNPEVGALLQYSARLGRDPLMIQGSTGNTSIKLGNILWIKASGRRLANAEREAIFVPVDLATARRSIAHDADPAADYGGSELRASVETAMHCVIPERVVVHVHCINAIAWAVRRDGPEQLARLFSGLPWAWVPYAPSGLRLAHQIEDALSRHPGARALLLGNHGLVLGGPDVASASALLAEVDRRLAPATPSRAPRAFRNPKAAARWLAADPVSRHILAGGYLYPCHALHLAGFDAVSGAPPADLGGEAGPALNGLAEVLSRIPASANLRYLTPAETSELLASNVYGSRDPQCEHAGAALHAQDGLAGQI